jgi:hypothetical protein
VYVCGLITAFVDAQEFIITSVYIGGITITWVNISVLPSHARVALVSPLLALVDPPSRL